MSYLSNNRTRRQPRGYVAGLSPEGQINKVIADINSLKDGYNLRAWSASARKELTPALTITLVVGEDVKSEVHVPNLPFIVVSPVIRNYLLQNPSAVKAKFVHPAVSLGAVQKIAAWLTDVCLKQDFPELHIPNDLGDPLKLRLTAHTLGMESFTGYFDAYYIDALQVRVPSLCEIDTVLENTGKDKKGDAIVVTLANHISYLCRYHKVFPAEEKTFADILAQKKYEALLLATSDTEVEAMAERYAMEPIPTEVVD